MSHFGGGECRVGGGERELWCKMAVPSVSNSLEKITEKMGKNKIEVVERIASYVSQHTFDIREGFKNMLGGIVKELTGVQKVEPEEQDMKKITYPNAVDITNALYAEIVAKAEEYHAREAADPGFVNHIALGISIGGELGEMDFTQLAAHYRTVSSFIGYMNEVNAYARWEQGRTVWKVWSVCGSRANFKGWLTLCGGVSEKTAIRAMGKT